MRVYEFRYEISERGFSRMVTDVIRTKWPRQAINEANKTLEGVPYVAADLIFYRKRQSPDIRRRNFVHASEIRYKVIRTWGDLRGAQSLPIGTIG